jgi:hypothetical protein
LVEFLKRDSFWLKKCGFRNPPSHNSFSDFVDRVGADACEQLFYYLVERIREFKSGLEQSCLTLFLLGFFSRYLQTLVIQV